MPRTSTSQSIASSNSSSTIASSYSSSSTSSSSAMPHNNSSYSTTSPSSISSTSSTSSSHHVPLTSSSPRNSRQQSPTPPILASTQPFFINGAAVAAATALSTISPSGLLTDGPLARRPVVSSRVSAASPRRDRDRSESPANGSDQGRRNLYQHPPQTSGSNSSLHTIQETKIPAKIPTGAVPNRKSFLPQPVTYSNGQQQLQQQQQQFTSSRQRQSSSSPVR